MDGSLLKGAATDSAVYEVNEARAASGRRESIMTVLENDSVSSENERGLVGHPREHAIRRTVSHIEPVPNYTQKRAPVRLVAPTRLIGRSVSQMPVSAGTASFGTVPETVIDDDDRTVVPDPTGLPWRHICALRILSQSGQEYVGTGWFIGPKTLVTAGHCVFLHDDGGWPVSIKVIPALNGNVEPYGDITSTRFRATSGWIQSQDTNLDYGAIQLEKEIGASAGYFSFAALGDGDLTDTDANISGYPFDRDHATRQYFHARRVSKTTPQKLFYEIDTFGGQSGSPIWLTLEGDRRIAIGVHTTGSASSNSGTRITREVFENLSKWRDEPAIQPARVAEARR
jgi:glutamyl endopeptidase